jgi:hypothetical protein
VKLKKDRPTDVISEPVVTRNVVTRKKTRKGKKKKRRLQTPVITTIIAIYGAILSTVSALLGAWYFLRSGPRLQAEAYVFPPVGENWEEFNDNSLIELHVWNAGRGEITVNILYVNLLSRQGWIG